MQRSIIASTILIALATGCGTTVFRATFEADTVGQPPQLSPAGEPAGDAIALFNREPTVIDPTADDNFNWNAAGQSLLMDNGGVQATTFDAIPVGTPLTEGNVTLLFTVEAAAGQSPLLVSFMNNNLELGTLKLGMDVVKNGKQVVAQPGTNSFPWLVELTVNVDQATLSGTVIPNDGVPLNVAPQSIADQPVSHVRFHVDGTAPASSPIPVEPMLGRWLLDIVEMQVD